MKNTQYIVFFCKKSVSSDKMRHLQNKAREKRWNGFREDCGIVRKTLRKYYTSETREQGLLFGQKRFPLRSKNIPVINRIVEKFRIVAL